MLDLVEVHEELYLFLIKQRNIILNLNLLLEKTIILATLKSGKKSKKVWQEG
ncbi:hypothetical protein [uncultured Chryseobacterium sp.]|uniref:hypothetical protein n=1 Tax=uncultured Chryseobacterium sp. TaxID=259322 RepID=UPI0025E7F6BA|nr:hypothetical protein [uncultured Chryseobacterium sp.]